MRNTETSWFALGTDLPPSCSIYCIYVSLLVWLFRHIFFRSFFDYHFRPLKSFFPFVAAARLFPCSYKCMCVCVCFSLCLFFVHSKWWDFDQQTNANEKLIYFCIYRWIDSRIAAGKTTKFQWVDEETERNTYPIINYCMHIMPKGEIWLLVLIFSARFLSMDWRSKKKKRVAVQQPLRECSGIENTIPNRKKNRFVEYANLYLNIGDCIDKYSRVYNIFFSCFVIMASLMHVNESVSEIGREHRMMFDMNVLENIFRILWLAIIRLPFNNKIAT